MKREVSRERALPAFLLTLDDLCLLIEKLRALFNAPEEVNLSVEMQLPNEKIRFDTIDELRSHTLQKDRVTNFYVGMWQKGNHASIRSRRAFLSKPQVAASGDQEAWCAGVIDTVLTFVTPRKLWYSWFTSAPIDWLLVILFYVPLFGSGFINSHFPQVTTNAWMWTFAAIGILYICKESVLPSTIIKLNERESFLRAHTAEISLVLALISVLLTIAGWFVDKP